MIKISQLPLGFANANSVVPATNPEGTATEKIKLGDIAKLDHDVLEFANLAALPVIGETGKIYVVLDNNKTYRWSGSAYVEISASPGNTDAVPEGSVNKYYTDARAIAAAPVQSVNGLTGAVIIDSSDTGDITFSGIKIIGSGNNSGDGNNKGTIELVPDISLYNNDQYLVVDPTAPNHIHLRAGGDQDNSNAQLIIGGENTHIRIVDSENNVSIKTISGGNTQSFDLGNTDSVATDLVSFSDIPIGSTFTDDGVTYTITDKSFDSSVGFVYTYSISPQIKPPTAGGNFNGSYDFVLPISDKIWAFENTGNINIPGNIILNNGTTVAVGTYDNSTGGNGGISLNCVVGYELNWQGGRLKSTYNNGVNTNPLYIDSPISADIGNFTQLTVNNTNISLEGHNHDDRYYTENETDNLLATKQAIGNYATLVGGQIPSSQLPGYVDDVIEYSDFSSFPSVGETGKIYFSLDTNKTYRWSGSTYVEIVASPGSTDSVPEGSINKYYTDVRASAAAPVQSVAGRTGNVILTKNDVGLNQVNNTSDIDKPISTATQNALNLKINSSEVNTDLVAGAGISLTYDNVNDSLTISSAVNSVAGKTGSVLLTKSDVGLNNVDNTSDLNKPISSATQAALNTKQASGNYATLVNGTIPASQLPSYVDDIVEYASFSVFPATGESGKIYLALNNNTTYRWSGSTYVAISSSPGTTDSVPEGSVNKYYTDARASAAAPVQSVAGRTGIVTLTKNDVGLDNVNNTRDADKPISTATQTALDGKANSSHTHDDRYYTESEVDTLLTGKAASSHTHDDLYYTETEVNTLLAGKQDAGTYATLVGGLVPASQLPSYVDDVLEFANLAAFPVSGETGKIYVALDNNKTYRWSGSAYVEISASPGSTDAVPEGSVNLYYTNARASAAAPVQSVDGKTGNVTVRPRVVVDESLPGGGFGDTIYVRRSDNTIWSYDGAFQQITSPLAPHKSTHSLLGSDPLTPADIGAMHVAGNGINSIVPRLGGCAAIGVSSVVSGGNQNVANGSYSVVAGGDGNSASNNSSVVSGGLGNSAANSFSVIGGGQENSAIADYATVAGGQKNAARGGHSYIAGGLNNLAFSVGSAAAGINNVAAQKVRRASNINASTNTITVINALAADFDSVGTQALEIRYFSASLGWQRTTRTVSTATQSGSNVNLVLTATVGGTEQWTDVTVVNTFESDASAGQIVYGTNNTACGLFDVVAGGIGNSATGGYGFVGGGNNNSANGQQAIVVGGSTNTATSTYSTIVGGIANTAGNSAFVGGGASNVASGQHSVIAGGQNNVASVLHANVLGGFGNTAAGDYSAMIGGARGKTRLFGEVSHAVGHFANAGDAQHCMLVARRTTTDATPNQPLFLNNTDLRIGVPAKSMWSFSIKLAAYSMTDNLGAWWIFRGGIRRDGTGNTVLVGSVASDFGADINFITAGISQSSASVVADDTNDALEVRVTGLSGKTIRWVASIDLAQVCAEEVQEYSPIVNSGFESGSNNASPVGWQDAIGSPKTYTISSVDGINAADGQLALLCSASTSFGAVSQNTPLRLMAGATYRLSAQFRPRGASGVTPGGYWVRLAARSVSSPNTVFILANEYGGSDTLTSGAWAAKTLTWTAPSSLLSVPVITNGIYGTTPNSQADLASGDYVIEVLVGGNFPSIPQGTEQPTTQTWVDDVRLFRSVLM